MNYAVIMAGGKGERFWPKSRTSLPKQFLALTTEESLIQQTVRRIGDIVNLENIFIVTNEAYQELVVAQLPELPLQNIILEPVGRNTAPCIGLAAKYIYKRDKAATMIILPSDHLIKDEEEFLKVLEVGVDIANETGNLVTIGIKPDRPETGYGYIQVAGGNVPGVLCSVPGGKSEDQGSRHFVPGSRLVGDGVDEIATPLARNDGTGVASGSGALCSVLCEKSEDQGSRHDVPGSRLVGDLMNEIATPLARNDENLVLCSRYSVLGEKKIEKKVYDVKRFVEKPDLETAEGYLASGDYLWNSGMFIWKAAVILDKIGEHLPELAGGLDRIEAYIGAEVEQEVLKEQFPLLPSISIDYGVMEKEQSIKVIPGDFGWDDLGSWTALEKLLPTDEDNNSIRGKFLAVDTRNCTVFADDKLIATVGVEDLVVVQTDDAILICSKDKVQDIKKLVGKLKAESLTEYI